MVLLALTMCVIEFNDFMVAFTEICPPGFNLYIGRKEELTFFINCPLGYFITCTKGKVLLKPFTCYFFPVTSDVNSFPFSRCCYILALRFCNLKPFFPAFLTQIPFDNKAASGIYQNGYIINVIITRIKPYQKRFISKLPTQVYCLEKELHSTVLAVFLQLRHFCKS